MHRAQARAATQLRAGGATLQASPQRPLIMGILNLGSDSVADELRLQGLPQQLRRAEALIADGSAIVDIGVQSGRTDTKEVPAAEEIELLAPIVSALSAKGVLVSVDTYRASVADAAVKAGASIVNDVGGLSDPEIASVAAESGAALVLMHTRAEPKVAHFPGYEDPVADVKKMLANLMQRAADAGVSPDQIILDPGLDYAKSPQESIEVLRRLKELHALDRPLLLAVSRKYFLGMLTNRPPMERLASTLAAVGFGLDAGASILRVHDVAQVSDFLTVRAALASDGAARLEGDPHAETLKWLPPKEAPHSPDASPRTAPDTPFTGNTPTGSTPTGNTPFTGNATAPAHTLEEASA